MLPLNDSGTDGDNVIVSKNKKRNREGKTYVFEIQLTEYTNDSYAEYNWKELVKKEEERRIDPDIEIIEIDDDPVPKKKKVSEKIDPEDDYDLADDFIDDSEVNDEEVPDEVTTAYGGFYINVGSLKFRYTSDDKEKHKPRTHQHEINPNHCQILQFLRMPLQNPSLTSPRAHKTLLLITLDPNTNSLYLAVREGSDVTPDSLCVVS